jgi:hypothetical protein
MTGADRVHRRYANKDINKITGAVHHAHSLCPQKQPQGRGPSGTRECVTSCTSARACALAWLGRWVGVGGWVVGGCGTRLPRDAGEALASCLLHLLQGPLQLRAARRQRLALRQRLRAHRHAASYTVTRRGPQSGAWAKCDRATFSRPVSALFSRMNILAVQVFPIALSTPSRPRPLIQSRIYPCSHISSSFVPNQPAPQPSRRRRPRISPWTCRPPSQIPPAKPGNPIPTPAPSRAVTLKTIQGQRGNLPSHAQKRESRIGWASKGPDLLEGGGAAGVDAGVELGGALCEGGAAALQAALGPVEREHVALQRGHQVRHLYVYIIYIYVYIYIYIYIYMTPLRRW